MSEWKTYRLSDLINLVGGGTPKTTVPEYWNGEIPWLSVVDFGKSIKKVYQTEKSITEKGLNESSTKILKEGQIIISARGTVGELAVLGRDMAFNQSCYGIYANDKTENNFLYYLLKYSIGKIKKNTHGAVFDTITKQTFDNIEVSIPENKATQRQIAQILSSLDDKIELNLQMNQTLEAMAQAIFKEWFVNFNFPGFDGELVDGLPKGWNRCLIKDFGKIVCGKTPSKAVKEYFGGEYMFIKIPDMHNSVFIIETTDSLTEEGLNSQSNKTIPPFSICVSSIATVGLVCINPEPCQTNQQINSIVPKNKDSRYFLYFLTTSMKDTFLATASGGTATLNMNTSQFSNIGAFMPGEDILKEFDVIVSPIMEKILENEYNIKSLTQTRDTLLPKLMSGQLKIV
ncbi:MAG TPA: restriction endonuclease subunit S [Bacteroidales bacterium]|jgi:type I restriction enzyme S subunit|nr:restriction endonuclease subunit S [Bacteroidales bacterium]